jgi:mannitol-specific phosphotransferase system IIBC component
MLHVSFLGVKAGTIGGSSVPEWLGQMISGPLLGTFSIPDTLNRPTRYVRVIARISQRKAA